MKFTDKTAPTPEGQTFETPLRDVLFTRMAPNQVCPPRPVNSITSNRKLPLARFIPCCIYKMNDWVLSVKEAGVQAPELYHDSHE